MDNNLAHSQRAIGESSNLAQLALTYTYNFPTEHKYEDYVCILSVLAQLAIDSAKRRYDIDISEEIKRIKTNMNIKANGYPAFWLIIRRDFDKSKINYNLVCPMNKLFGTRISKYRSNAETISMEEFYQPYAMDNTRRKCKKVEDLINKYRLNLLNSFEEEEGYLLLRADFDRLIAEIRQVYLSKTYYGLVSWLVDRAFCITPYAKMCVSRNSNQTVSGTKNNRALLLKVLYKISPNAVLAIFGRGVR